MLLGTDGGEVLSRLLDQNTLAVIGAFVTMIVAIIVINWRRVEQHRTDAALKQDMIARGMSPDEVERVLKAKSSRTW